MSFHVLEPGLFSLIVDLGRPHTRSLGVPVGGAADRTSFMLGNALVGNPPDSAALEISLAGPMLRAESDLGCVVYGAPFDLRCGLRELQAGKTFTLHAGEVLRIGGTSEGMRAYLCVRGGIQSPLVMGSRSALRPIKGGDAIPCTAGTLAGRFFLLQSEWDSWLAGFSSSSPFKSLRVLAGTQADWFPANSLFGAAGGNGDGTFAITSASNRMGLRLSGPPFPIPDRELLSEAVCPGSVQVTRDGQCIILGMDGQTIGGYPKLAQVISADLDQLGQLRPGDKVRFVPVSLEEAEGLHHVKMKELHRWLTRLQLAV
jgi:antagonist of KipI